VGKKGNRGEKIQRDLVGLSGKFDHVRWIWQYYLPHGNCSCFNFIICWGWQAVSLLHLFKVDHKIRVILCVTERNLSKYCLPMAQWKNCTWCGGRHMETPIHGCLPFCSLGRFSHKVSEMATLTDHYFCRCSMVRGHVISGSVRKSSVVL
jgi:hypothetical protein